MAGVMRAATSALDRSWTTVCAPLIAALNLAFQPEPGTGHVSGWKVVLWFALNLAFLFTALALEAPTALFWTMVAFLMVHILIILSSLRIMTEERRVMEGTLPPDKMTFSVFDAVNNVPVFASSVAFYLLGLPALMQNIESTGLMRLLKQRPKLDTGYLSYLACVLNEVPLVNTVMNAGANLANIAANLAAEIVYQGLPGNALRLLIVATVSVVVVRAIVLRLQHWSHHQAMATAIEAHEPELHAMETMHKRLLRVPAPLADRLMKLATTHPEAAVRKRAITAMGKLKVLKFPHAFLSKLHDEAEHKDHALAAIWEQVSGMSERARQAIAPDVCASIDRQLGEMKEAHSASTRALLEELKSLLGRKKAGGVRG